MISARGNEMDISLSLDARHCVSLGSVKPSHIASGQHVNHVSALSGIPLVAPTLSTEPVVITGHFAIRADEIEAAAVAIINSP